MKDILNFYQLTDKIASGGQPLPHQFSEIQKAGYSIVINLAMSDATNAVPEEEKIVSSLGLTHIHIPVPFDRPDLSHVKAFFGIMDAFKTEKVFVHCALNLRVSAFLYLYLTHRHNLSPEQATTPFLTAWQPKMDEKWRGILGLTKQELGEIY
ncbi:MAG: protein tyrosine phosphatase family protein [Spongiibacteraceae bacterium]